MKKKPVFIALGVCVGVLFLLAACWLYFRSQASFLPSAGLK